MSKKSKYAIQIIGSTMVMAMLIVCIIGNVQGWLPNYWNFIFGTVCLILLGVDIMAEKSYKDGLKEKDNDKE